MAVDRAAGLLEVVQPLWLLGRGRPETSPNVCVYYLCACVHVFVQVCLFIWVCLRVCASLYVYIQKCKNVKNVSSQWGEDGARGVKGKLRVRKG